MGDKLNIYTPIAYRPMADCFFHRLNRAIAGPRLSQRNTRLTQVDQNFETTDLTQQLLKISNELSPVKEIDVVTSISISPEGQIMALSKFQRRDGGSAMTEE